MQHVGVYFQLNLCTLFNHCLVYAGTETDAAIWTLAEVRAAVVGACLPTLRPIFTGKQEMSDRIAPKLYKIHVSSSYGVSSSAAVLRGKYRCTSFVAASSGLQ